MNHVDGDLARCEALAVAGANGDDSACLELVKLLWPSWLAQARGSRSLGALARSEDHVHEVATRLAEKIGRKGGYGLRLYPHWRHSNPDKTFLDWMRIVAANLIRDYAREQFGSTRPPEGEIGAKRLLNEFATSPALDELSVRPPFTDAQTARELLEYAQDYLPAEQLSALELWLQAMDFEAMDHRLQTKPGGARELMRAAVANLRRQFGPKTAAGKDSEGA